MRKYKFTLARTLSRLAILLLFALGAAGLSGWILAGDLSASVAFSKLSLADPFACLQLFLAGGALGFASLSGAFVVAIFYALIAPRAFCGWVCPVGLLSDFSSWFGSRFFSFKILKLDKNARYYVLAFCLVLSALLGVAVFESVSFIGIVSRGVLFGSAGGLGVALLIVLFELFVLKGGVCGHLCPLGAFYALLSRYAIFRIKHNASSCTKCGKCFLVCPEKQVLDIIGKQSGSLKNSECVSCGRCVQVCDDASLEFSIIDLRRK